MEEFERRRREMLKRVQERVDPCQTLRPAVGGEPDGLACR